MNKFKYIYGDDLYIWGFRRDCVEFLNDAPKDWVDLIVTDPPYYGTSESSGGLISNGLLYTAGRAVMQKYDTFDSPKEYLEFMKRVLKCCFRVMRKGASLFMWIDRKYGGVIAYMAETLGFLCKNVIHAVKSNVKYNNQGNFLSAYETCIYLIKGKKASIFNWLPDFDMRNIWMIDNYSFKVTDHPNEKPAVCYSIPIKVASNPGSVVLDMFAGSGVCGVVCESLNRNCVLVERDQVYFDSYIVPKFAETEMKLAETM